MAPRALLRGACFAVSLLILPSLHEDPLDGLRARLRASDKWTRAEAVEELARVGGAEAWELVLGALADPKGEVADAAQLALAGLDDPRTLARLGREQGLRAEDALVRARAAEVLGRLSAAEEVAELVERALGDPDAEVRRMAAWSVERLARGGKLADEARAELGRELEKREGRERDALARGRMLAALCAVAPEAGARALGEALRAREPLLRGAAAAIAATALAPEEALGRLAALAADEDPGVRRAALEGLGELRTRGAAACLVERLSREGEERMLLRAVELLRGMSALKHGRDPRPWNDWVRGLPADWTAAPPRRAEPESADPGRTRVALAGLPITSKRVAILIDLSGSIWNVRPDGRTRKEVVDGKLRETLEALPEDTRFNLIPYTGVPHPWKERLVPATRAKVREAARWFEECRENGSGNFWDAAMLALEDAEVDTLVVLFDGAPTGGTRHRLELIVPLFLERNMARRVTLDLVLVDASRKLQRMWGELAEGTGGRVVSVSF